MPFLLRKVRRPRWYHNVNLGWLQQGEIPADPLTDLDTQSNKLSLWHVEDDESNLDQVVTAIAATREHLDKVDYALLDQRYIWQLDIQVEKTPGGTPLAEADLWHRDLTHLSAQKLLDLAKVMWDRARTARRPEKAVRQLLVKAVDSGRIDTSKLKDTLRSEIGSSALA